MASAKTSKSLHVSYNQHILECLIEGGVGGGGVGINKEGRKILQNFINGVRGVRKIVESLIAVVGWRKFLFDTLK